MKFFDAAAVTMVGPAPLIEPPASTACAGTSSICQFKSKPFSERMKLPASTHCTSSFFPTDNGSICCMGTGNCIRELEGRTTSEDMRASRAAMASASA